MNERTHASALSAGSRADGQRCPACGQKLDDPPPPRCPLCRHELASARPSTGEDHTPYAQARASGEPGFWSMVRWVALADTPRLKHLALIRASEASRRFATCSILIASLGLALLQIGNGGWHTTPASPAVGPQQPSGAGWIRVASAATPLPPNLPPEHPTQLWWNPAQTVIATALAFVLGWSLLNAMMRMLRWLVRQAHSEAYRSEQRLSAGLHYSALFLIALLPTGAAAAFQPLGQFLEVSGATASAARQVMSTIACVPVALAFVLWWFWLTRLGSTAPPRTRGRVLACLILGFPVSFLAAAAAWWFTLRHGLPPLFGALGVQF